MFLGVYRLLYSIGPMTKGTDDTQDWKKVFDTTVQRREDIHTGTYTQCLRGLSVHFDHMTWPI